MQRVLQRVRYNGSDPTARFDERFDEVRSFYGSLRVSFRFCRASRFCLPAVSALSITRGLIFVDTFAWANRPECQFCLLLRCQTRAGYVGSTRAPRYSNKVSRGMIERCMLLIIAFRRVVRSAGVLSAAVSTVLRRIGCLGLPCREFRASRELRAALLNGLRDASGHRGSKA